MLSEAQHLPGPPHYANPQRECFPESPPLQPLTLTEASNMMLKGPDSEVTGQAVMENRARLPGRGSQLLHPAGCVLQGSHFIFCLGVPICKMGTGRVSASPGLCVCVCVCARTLSCVRIFVTSQTAAWDARDPLSRGFPRQEYWSGLPFPSPGHLLHPGIELVSPEFWQANFLPLIY